MPRDVNSEIKNTHEKVQKNAFESNETRQTSNVQGDPLLQATNKNKQQHKKNQQLTYLLPVEFSPSYLGCVHEIQRLRVNSEADLHLSVFLMTWVLTRITRDFGRRHGA